MHMSVGPAPVKVSTNACTLSVLAESRLTYLIHRFLQPASSEVTKELGHDAKDGNHESEYGENQFEGECHCIR